VLAVAWTVVPHADTSSALNSRFIRATEVSDTLSRDSVVTLSPFLACSLTALALSQVGAETFVSMRGCCAEVEPKLRRYGAEVSGVNTRVLTVVTG
jgi:hypothetical protein